MPRHLTDAAEGISGNCWSINCIRARFTSVSPNGSRQKDDRAIDSSGTARRSTTQVVPIDHPTPHVPVHGLSFRDKIRWRRPVPRSWHATTGPSLHPPCEGVPSFFGRQAPHRSTVLAWTVQCPDPPRSSKSSGVCEPCREGDKLIDVLRPKYEN